MKMVKAASDSSSLVYIWALLIAAMSTLLLVLRRFLMLRRSVERQLPPGSMGWLPIVGETWEYAIPNGTDLFMQKRMQQYGELFKSHLFGDPIIVSCNPKINRFILEEENKLFRSSYPRAFKRILGEKNLTELRQGLHKTVRGSLINVLASGLRTNEYMKDLSTTIARTLGQWEGRVIRLQEETTKMAYFVAVKRLLGYNEEDPEAINLREHYFCLIEGFISIPINFPGSAYHKSMQARAKIAEIIDDMISKRKANRHVVSRDLVDNLIAEEEKANNSVTEEVVRDSILSILFAGHDTVSKAMVFAVRLLLDNPKVMGMLREEHVSIQDHVKKGEELTWEHYKSMTFSNNVVSEILRLINIAPGVFREALENVEIDGFVIPKGYRVMAYFKSTHLDPTNFQDPHQFNPWRWKTISSRETNFMPFGGGPRLCPGIEFAKLQICIFLHHLLLKYSFKQVEEDEILYSPYIKFKNGFPILFQNNQY